ncbi:MAG: alcohol dehydrogenase catalytic domain-containing protein [Luteitalea sp.]|nr:alcohol dehydrogenase catalytic domain-containing protein [Luteitalea sp.]
MRRTKRTPVGQALVQIFDGPGQPFRLEPRPFPDALATGEVLVQTRLATICGSDLHTTLGQRDTPVPCVLGHEAVGRVIHTGRGRSHLAPGARVSWSVVDSCGKCQACRQHRLPEKCESVFKYGHAALSDGSGLNGCYASHVLLRAGTHIARVPDAIPDAVVAPANCALATMVNVVSQVPHACDTVVIQGAGLLGLYGCALLRERGVPQVFCVDPSERRLEYVSLFGGIPIAGDMDQYATARRQILANAPGGVDAVVEVAGVPAVVPEGVRLLRPGGFYALAGMVHPGSALEITGEEIIRKCLTIRGTHNYSPFHLDQALTFLARTVDKYPYESLVSPAFELADLESALQMAARQTFLRVAVESAIQ